MLERIQDILTVNKRPITYKIKVDYLFDIFITNDSTLTDEEDKIEESELMTLQKKRQAAQTKLRKQAPIQENFEPDEEIL